MSTSKVGIVGTVAEIAVRADGWRTSVASLRPVECGAGDDGVTMLREWERSEVASVGAAARRGQGIRFEAGFGGLTLHRSSGGLGALRLTADNCGWGTWVLQRHRFESVGLHFGGGTDELQRNIIADCSLGLSRNPRRAADDASTGSR